MSFDLNNLKDTISDNINNLMQQQNNNSSPNSLKTTMNTNGSVNLQEQALIDKTLISAGLPENKINSLIALAADKLMCDGDCQQKRSSANYKHKWELAKKNYADAPEDIRQAEKNYYVFDKGYPAYKDMLYDRYAKTAAEFKKTSNEKYKKVNEEILQLIDTNDTSTTYLQRMNELLRIKLGENEDLKRDIDQYLAQTQTSGRKVIYEDRGRDWLTTVRKIILFFYFSLLVGYIILGNFIPNQLYKQWKVWLYIALYIAFPLYVLDRMVRFAFYLLSLIESFSLRKNVYTNI